MDFVYEISEGEVYWVCYINVYIMGDYGVIKWFVVFNWILFSFGDVIDICEIWNSERCFCVLGLFVGDFGMGFVLWFDVKLIDVIESECVVC